MDEPIDIDSFRPHFLIQDAASTAHIIPLAALRGVASGLIPPANLGDAVLQAIVSEWLQLRGAPGG